MEQVVNFLNKLEPEKTLPKSLVGMILAWGAVIVGYCGFAAYLYWDESALAAEHKALVRSNQQLQAELDAKNVADAQVDLLGPTTELDQLRRKKQQRRLLIANLKDPQLNNIEGFSEYLTGLARQHRTGVAIEKIRLSQHGSTFFMAGKLREPDQLPAYIVRLGHESSFNNMAFESVKIGTEDNALEFEIQSFAGVKAK